MSLNQFYNTLLLFLVVSISFGKILIPQGYSGNPEILQKNNKEKEYYEINNRGLEYIAATWQRIISVLWDIDIKY